jgi:hypothetical protein
MMLRYHLALLHHRLRRLLRRDGRLRDSDAVVETLWPEEAVSGPPAIHLPGELEKALRPAFGRLEDEIAKARGGPFRAGPTLRLRLRHAALDNRVLYSGGRRKDFVREDFVNPPPPDRSTPVVRFGRAVSPSSYVGCNFFGHWLRDDCTAWLLAEEDVAAGASRFTVWTPDWADKQKYAALFGQDWTPLARCWAEELTLYHDISHNTHKVGRYRQLRALIREARPPGPAGELVYIPRGRSGKSRPVVNEAALIAALEARGGRVFPAESAATLAATHRDCRIVISVEGSQCAHGLYALREGGGLMVIQPPTRFYNAHQEWARQLGMHYALIVADEVEEGFQVDIHRFLRTLDLLERQLG